MSPLAGASDEKEMTTMTVNASARAVSVFPTPVGPRKMNEPIGRLGSLSPARERLTAFETACTASS